MVTSSRFGWLSLTTIFLLCLSFLNIATATPLLDLNDKVKEALVARDEPKLISEARYIEFLKQHFPRTERYLLYSGNSEDQIKAFKAVNPGYYYYDDMYNARDTNHPWYEFFDANTDMDDAEAASRAIAKVATKQILVFGAAEYKTEGARSFYTLQEFPALQDSIKAGKISEISHMAKDATRPSEVMAKEDASGMMTWQSGYKEGTKNASGSSGNCRRDGGDCDKPVTTDKKQIKDAKERDQKRRASSGWCPVD
jgi:hypothetical protein